MKFFNVLFILVITMLYSSNLCAGLFLPLLKGLEKQFIYSSYAPSYNYRNSRGYSHGYYGGYRSQSFGNYHSGAKAYHSRPHRTSSRRTGRTYSDIASVINANPYAFVGSRPFPAQPFYPQG